MRKLNTNLVIIVLITASMLFASGLCLSDDTATQVQPAAECLTVMPCEPLGQPPFDTHDKAAKKAIESFLDPSYFKLISEKEAKLLGFKSKAEIKTARPGVPFEVWVVGVKQLQNFKPGDDVNKVIANANLVLYPLMVGEEIRSSLTVRKTTGWVTTQWTSGSLVRELSKHRTSPSTFAISVPSLNLYFVADKSQSNLILIPITPYPVHGYTPGMRLAAERVFDELKKDVQHDTGDPR